MANQNALVIPVVANLTALRQQFQEQLGPVLATTKTQLAQAAGAFDGSRIIAQAGAAMSALQKMGGELGSVGGVAKLTDTEQAKLNATIGQAIQKYEALGATVPDEMRAIYQATKQTNDGVKEQSETLGRLKGGVLELAGAVGIGFGVGAVVQFTKKIFDSASAIHDQAEALGFSAEAFQRNKFAAEQTGGSVEAFTKSANKLNENLANGSDKVVEALKEIGLQYTSIRAMKPEDAWQKVTDAIGKVEDPMLRAAAAQELLGKGSRELMPGIIEGLHKIGEAADVMSDQTVNDLEAAQDKWDEFWHKIVIVSGNAIGFLMDADKKRAQAARESLLSMTADQQEAWARQFAVNQAMANGTKYADEYARALKILHPVYADIHLAADTTKKKTEELTEAQKKQQAEIKALVDQWTGAAMAAKVTELNQAFTQTVKQGGFTAHELAALGDELVKLRNNGAVLPKQLNDIANAFDHTAQTIPRAITPIVIWTEDLDKLTQRFNSLYQAGLKLPWLTSGTKLQAAPLFSKEQLQNMADFSAGLGVVKGLTDDLGRNMSGTGRLITAAFSQAIGIAQTYIHALEVAKTKQDVLNAASAATMGGLAAVIGVWASLMAENYAKYEADAQKIIELNNKISQAGQTPSQNPMTVRGNPAVDRGSVAKNQSDAMKELERQAAAVDAAAKRAKDDQDALTAAMSRYGLAADAAGTDTDRFIRLVYDQMVPSFERLAKAGFSVSQITKGATSDLNAMISQALTLGKKLPASLQPYITELVRSGGLTDELKRRILGLADPAPWKDMEEAAGRYNISLDAMGKGFQQAKLDDQVKQLTDDWKLFASNGADMGAVMDGMKDKVQDVINNSLKFGTDIPASMKPMLEAMAKAGKLTDDQGNALTDLTKLNFAADLSADFDTLIKKLDDLISRIGDVGSGLSGLNVPGGGGSPTPGSSDAPHAHAGAFVTMQGIQRFHQGSARVARILRFPGMSSDEFPAILQAGEAVIRKSAVDRIGTATITALNRGDAAPASSPVSVSITVNPSPGMDERGLASKMAEVFERNVGGALTRVRRVI